MFSIFKKGSSLLALFFILFANSVYSAEVAVKELSIDEVYATGVDKIEILFSNEISENSLAEFGSMFRIEDIDNTNEIINVEEKTIDSYNKKIIILDLDKDLVDAREYRIIVLKIEDVFGQNITFGVDSEASFVYSSNPEWESNNTNTGSGENIELNSASENPKDIITNSGKTTEDNTGTIENTDINKGNIAGTKIDAKDIESQVEVLASDNSKLPTAGPEHILVLILALVLGGGLLIFSYKRT